MRGFRGSNKTVQRQEQEGERKGEESTVGLSGDKSGDKQLSVSLRAQKSPSKGCRSRAEPEHTTPLHLGCGAAPMLCIQELSTGLELLFYKMQSL